MLAFLLFMVTLRCKSNKPHILTPSILIYMWFSWNDQRYKSNLLNLNCIANIQYSRIERIESNQLNLRIRSVLWFVNLTSLIVSYTISCVYICSIYEWCAVVRIYTRFGKSFWFRTTTPICGPFVFVIK